jgi:putative membrane protein
MKIVIIDNKKNKRINAFLDWLIYMIGSALVLIAVSLIFKNTVQIDNSYFGIWGLAAAIIIYYLNKTIKPVLIWLTLPITGLTLGLFYPFINVFILNIVDFILGDYFTINGIWMSFLVAIFISIMNAIMEEVIVKSIINKGDRYE